MSKFKLHAKKVNGDNQSYYIYLYKLETGKKKPEIVILRNPLTNKGIKIEGKYLLPNPKDFSKVSIKLPQNRLNGFESVEELNKFLETSLHNFIVINGDKRFISNDKKYIDDYLLKIIERQNNIGTKQTYINLKNTLLQFNLYRSKGKKSKLLFRDLDTDTIIEFHSWLTTEPNDLEIKYLEQYNSISEVEKIRLRERNTNNSANDKIKRLKAVINSSHKSGYYIYTLNPFLNYKRKIDAVKLDILTIEDLEKLINTHYVEVLRRTTKTKDGKTLWGKNISEGYLPATTNEDRNTLNKRYTQKHKLEDIRNYWLFQLFSQGIRVSDLITLRWWDFNYTNQLRIEKQMVKTRELINILVNDKMTDILFKYIQRYKSLYESEIITQEIRSLHKKMYENYYCPFYYTSEHIKLVSRCYNKFFDSLRDENNYQGDFPFIQQRHHHAINFLVNQEGINILKQDVYKNSQKAKIPIPVNKIRLLDELQKYYETSQKDYIEKNIHKLQSLKQSKFKMISGIIEHLSTHPSTKKNFVFTLLDDKDFQDIGPKNSFSNITEFQYRKFQSARTYYNKLLKLVSIQADIKKNLTTHLARHSYTSLMLELGENINLFDVMTSLGHKHLTTTQGYIRRFTNNKIDALNQLISNNVKTDFLV